MSLAGAASSAGSLLIIGAGVRAVSNALPRRRILPKPMFTGKKFKTNQFKITPIKIKPFKPIRF